MLFIREQGFDRDEYFATSTPQIGKQTELQDPIWGEGTADVSVYWVTGQSEGYYVHVERRYHSDELNTGYYANSAELVLTGKFWKWERAEEAVIAIQRFIHGKAQREGKGSE